MTRYEQLETRFFGDESDLIEQNQPKKDPFGLFEPLKTWFLTEQSTCHNSPDTVLVY